MYATGRDVRGSDNENRPKRRLGPFVSVLRVLRVLAGC